jgi:hypothetical protein
MPSSQPPLLKEIFAHEPAEKPVHMSVANLCKALNVGVSDIAPFIQQRYIKLVSAGHISSQATIEAIPEAAIIWMRSWFLPVQAKPLFSLENIADLLNVTVREVLPLCAQHEIPVTRDPVLGFTLSIWAARMLLLRTIRGREHTARFDRIALLHRILEKDPEKASQPPSFDQELEDELERVAKLDEPTRSLRSAQIWENLNDARLIAASLTTRETSSEIFPSGQSRETSCVPPPEL